MGCVRVSNRTFEGAVRLAAGFKGIPIMFHEIEEYIPKTDIIISCIDAPSYLISRNNIAERPPSKPLIIIDISVPRSIDPNVKEARDVHLFNIDDLQDVVQESLSHAEEGSRESNSDYRQ